MKEPGLSRALPEIPVDAENARVAGTGLAKDVDAFLAAVPADKRAALTRLRSTIKAAAPGAIELINYGVPMFRLGGKNLVSYAAAAAHCSFYVQSPAVMRAFAAISRATRSARGRSSSTPTSQSLPRW